LKYTGFWKLQKVVLAGRSALAKIRRRLTLALAKLVNLRVT
jgi:hypothetical protein